MKVGDAVRHKTKGTVGVVHEIAKHRGGVATLVNWTDKSGVMFRWAKAEDLEVF